MKNIIFRRTYKVRRALRKMSIDQLLELITELELQLSHGDDTHSSELRQRTDVD